MRMDRIANPSYGNRFIEAVEQKLRENNVTDRSIRGSNLEFNSKSGAVGVPKRIQPAHPNFDFERMFYSPFKSPNWMMNMLWMFGCAMLSSVVVGSLVGFGYIAEVAESRSGGKSEDWPDFTIDRLSDYIKRGLWPFLWYIIWSVPVALLVGGPTVITIWLSNVLWGSQQEVSATLVGVIGGSIAIAALIFCMIFMAASLMSSALGNDFMKGADMPWILSYLKKMGATTLFVGFVFTLISTLLSLIGLLACCVGVLAVAPFTYLMYADVLAQLHDIFVSRGGTPAFGSLHPDEDVVQAQVLG